MSSGFTPLAAKADRFRLSVALGAAVDACAERQTQYISSDTQTTLEEFFAQPRLPSRADEKPLHTQQPDATQLTAQLDKIQQLSERLFPGPVSFEHTFDPEDPTCEYIVFDVVAEGEFKDYCNREFQWHDSIEKIVPGVLSEFRLCVHPKP